MAGKYQQPRTICDVISDINHNNWILPNIQRKFVWDKDRICDLFDSLLRGYPIGTLMLWRVKRNLIPTTKFFTFLQNYQEKWAETCKDYRPSPAQEEVFAVIDGQQRLNSLYIGFTGSYAEKLPKKWWKNAYDEVIQPKEQLYLNICRKAEDSQSSREYDFAFFSADKLANDKEKNQWYQVGRILELPFIESEALLDDDDAFEQVLEKENVLDLVPTDFKTDAKKILKKLYRMTRHEQQINYYQEEIQDLDKVVDIFVRANSGGVPLAFSDLVMSVTVSQWTDARDKIDDLVKLIFTEAGFTVDRDFVLKNCLMVFSKDVKFRVKNFTSELIKKIENNFVAISNSIAKTCRFIKQIGITDGALRAKYALIPIVYYVYKNNLDIDNLAKNKDDKKKIAVWIKMALLKRMFGGQPDSILPKLREIIDNTQNAEFPLAEIVTHFKTTTKDITIDEEFITNKIENEIYGSGEALLVLLLLTDQDPQHEYAVDHMFPKSMFNQSNLKTLKFLEGDSEMLEFYKNPNNWNTLGNLQLLNLRENESKNASMLDVWLKSNPNYNKDLYFIPKNEKTEYIYKPNQFKEFVTQRRKLMIDAIMQKTKF